MGNANIFGVFQRGVSTKQNSGWAANEWKKDLASNEEVMQVQQFV